MPDTFSGPTLEQLKRSLRDSWMAGDFGVVARTISRSGRAFAHRVALAPGSRVLDVACGTGNVSIPLARAGCEVTGLDIAPNLLEQARSRALDEGLKIAFDEGDAEQMPYPDATFDAVVSMFGAMFAPRPEVVASELARVLRPGGTLAMANWSPDSFTAAMFRVGAKHVPPPPGMLPPVLWGDENTVRQRLAPYFHSIRTESIPVDFDLPTNAAGAVAFFRQYFGPTQMAFRQLDTAGQEALAADLESIWTKANTADDPETHIVVPNRYLEIHAVRS